jgi:hypothetical protein
MEVLINMTYKQIEASREARLWLSQIIIPAMCITMMVPEAREAVVTKVKEVKRSIKTAFTKN